ncbi:MAG: hypothetical protein LBJ87_03060, partial [bacterium]|nr:hypothetical protein [bacterium]
LRDRLRGSATGRGSASPSRDAAVSTGRSGAVTTGKRKPGTTRYTIDLTPHERRFVRMWAFENGVDAAAVFRVLLRRLEHDPALADQVLDDLQQPRTQRSER